MIGDMHYHRGETIRDVGDMRMDTHPQLTVGQVRSLPNGTELIAIHIAPMGMGIMFKGYVMDDEIRDGLLTAEYHEGCDHAMTHAEMEASLFPGSIFVTLLPHDYAPDPAEIINEKFVRKGFRDGSEGAPMASSSSLQNKFGDEWHENAYLAYTTAYKRGAENRKKGR